MSILVIFSAIIMAIGFLWPTGNGSALSIMLANTCLPLKSVPLAICILYPLAIGLFQNNHLGLYLGVALLAQLVISIAVGREVASKA